MTRGAALLLVLLGGCSEPPGDGLPAAVPVDSALVGALVDVQIAEARATLVAPAHRGAALDSLRAAALAAHGLTADALRDRQARLARDPAEARATYDAVATALDAARLAAP